ncbi:DsbA family oxidoreductase [Paenibacillus herberti]|uniref:Disulfide bond formation protein DsbA n=1 Tax=Paenibacillus herberti TaxID=1619309 RepID=A0A229NU76_9BACL|nr:DsbA family oxidoreductase [Paenibacillus herberti]OXM13433.1 disulfide bond formation protein DsbA [Paenibacillus herberti]
MKVEIWSDYACPFCYIGKRKFQEALESFEHKDDVEVVYRSFELDPGAEYAPGTSIHELLSRKYGMSVEQAIANNNNLGRQAGEMGLNFNFDAMKTGNTFDSHRLMAWAVEQGKGDELSERLFKAYFTDGLLLQDRQVLVTLAGEVGLSAEEAEQVLVSNRYSELVRAEEQVGSELGIRGVPFYVMDRKVGVSGAQSPASFLQVLQQAWAEKQAGANAPATAEPGANTAAGDNCADGSCEVHARD